jgi:hypothetical protein
MARRLSRSVETVHRPDLFGDGYNNSLGVEKSDQLHGRKYMYFEDDWHLIEDILNKIKEAAMKHHDTEVCATHNETFTALCKCPECKDSTIPVRTFKYVECDDRCPKETVVDIGVSDAVSADASVSNDD